MGKRKTIIFTEYSKKKKIFYIFIIIFLFSLFFLFYKTERKSLNQTVKLKEVDILYLKEELKKYKDSYLEIKRKNDLNEKKNENLTSKKNKKIEYLENLLVKRNKRISSLENTVQSLTKEVKKYKPPNAEFNEYITEETSIPIREVKYIVLAPAHGILSKREHQLIKVYNGTTNFEISELTIMGGHSKSGECKGLVYEAKVWGGPIKRRQTGEVRINVLSRISCAVTIAAKGKLTYK